MEFGQTIRSWWRGLRERWAAMRAQAAQTASAVTDNIREATHVEVPRVRAGLIARAALIVTLILFVAYPLYAWFYSTIDDNPSFAPPPDRMKPGMSRAVAATSALINREVNGHGWVANDPWFWPTALLDNMPNYQRGMMGALARFSFELTDQIGRARGSSEADSDLQTAAGLLQYPPDVWAWDPSVSFWPTATTESQYRKAMRALRTYNNRLAAGQAVFDTRTDNLQFTLDRIAADLGSSSAIIESHVRETAGFPIQNKTDDVFYSVKGQMYGYYIVLKGLQTDFAEVIKQRNLQKPWANMMESFRSGIALRPNVVLNGAPDSDVFACTLCGEGFYLLRARTQLREITNILQQ